MGRQRVVHGFGGETRLELGQQILSMGTRRVSENLRRVRCACLHFGIEPLGLCCPITCLGFLRWLCLHSFREIIKAHCRCCIEGFRWWWSGHRCSGIEKSMRIHKTFPSLYPRKLWNLWLLTRTLPTLTKSTLSDLSQEGLSISVQQKTTSIRYDHARLDVAMMFLAR